MNFDPIAHLRHRQTENWFIGHSSRDLLRLTEQTYQILQTWQNLQTARSQPPGDPVKILLVEPEPLEFIAYFLAASSVSSHLFLGNPQWATAEWQQVYDRIQPDVVLGSRPLAAQKIAVTTPRECSGPPALNRSLICIPTGGTSGQIRFAMHTWETLQAAVRGFQTFFQVEQVHSCCVLPLHHVSGLMQFLRSFLSGGQLLVLPFKTLAIAPPNHPAFDAQKFFLSLVPTQLHRLLDSSFSDFLPTFHTVLLGGAPPWSALLEQAKQRGIRLAPTYGMTETAAQIATLKPQDFLQGKTGCGQVLPHVQIMICAETGELLAPCEVGRVTIAADSLALGYYPDRFLQAGSQPTFQPDDLGWLDDRGYLHLVGRCSDKIITGGENVFPIEVEAAIRATGLVQDVCVLGIADADWGQVVTAVFVPLLRPEVPIEEVLAMLQTALVSQLSKFKHPKRWVQVDRVPRNAQGKVNRSQLTDLILSTNPTTNSILFVDQRVPSAATTPTKTPGDPVGYESPN